MSDQFESIEKSLKMMQSLIAEESDVSKHKEDRQNDDQSTYILHNPVSNNDSHLQKSHYRPTMYDNRHPLDHHQKNFQIPTPMDERSQEQFEYLLRKEINRRLPTLLDNWIKKNLNSVMEKRIDEKLTRIFSTDDDDDIF